MLTDVVIWSDCGSMQAGKLYKLWRSTSITEGTRFLEFYEQSRSYRLREQTVGTRKSWFTTDWLRPGKRLKDMLADQAQRRQAIGHQPAKKPLSWSQHSQHLEGTAGSPMAGTLSFICASWLQVCSNHNQSLHGPTMSDFTLDATCFVGSILDTGAETHVTHGSCFLTNLSTDAASWWVLPSFQQKTTDAPKHLCRQLASLIRGPFPFLDLISIRIGSPKNV